MYTMKSYCKHELIIVHYSDDILKGIYNVNSSVATTPHSGVPITHNVWAKLNPDKPCLTWSWAHRRKVTWSREGGRWRGGWERETGEEEVNILRGGEENQLKGSAAPVNTESLPVLRVANSLFKSNKKTVKTYTQCIEYTCIHLLYKYRLLKVTLRFWKV